MFKCFDNDLTTQEDLNDVILTFLYRNLSDDLLLGRNLGGEVEALLGAEDGEAHLEVKGVVHDIDVVLETIKILSPVVLESDKDEIGGEFTQTSNAHTHLGS